MGENHPRRQKPLCLHICGFSLALWPGYYTCWGSAHRRCEDHDGSNLVPATQLLFRDVAAADFLVGSNCICRYPVKLLLFPLGTSVSQLVHVCPHVPQQLPQKPCPLRKNLRKPNLVLQATPSFSGPEPHKVKHVHARVVSACSSLLSGSRPPQTAGQQPQLRGMKMHPHWISRSRRKPNPGSVFNLWEAETESANILIPTPTSHTLLSPVRAICSLNEAELSNISETHDHPLNRSPVPSAAPIKALRMEEELLESARG